MMILHILYALNFVCDLASNEIQISKDKILDEIHPTSEKTTQEGTSINQ